MAHDIGKIAVFLATPWGGGAERVLVTLANGMAKKGLDVDLVLYQASKRYLDEISDQVRLIDLNASGALTSVLPLVRYLRNEHPQVILSTIGQTNLATLWSRYLAGVDTRVIIREANTVSEFWQNARGIKGMLIPRLIPRFYPWADGIVAVSEGVADDLSCTMRIPRRKIKTIYNPADVEKIQSMSQEPVDHPWFCSGSPPVILGTGRLTPQKDFVTLIQAFSLLQRQKETCLVILGEGSERAKLESLVSELGLSDKVWMPGFVQNPYAYMSHASVFVLSSSFEGLPNTLIEAMVLGLPVVSTDCPNGPHEILKGGKYGSLVPVGDPEALADAMEVALSKPASIEQQLFAISHFALDSALDRYLNVMLGQEPVKASGGI